MRRVPPLPLGLSCPLFLITVFYDGYEKTKVVCTEGTSCRDQHADIHFRRQTGFTSPDYEHGQALGSLGGQLSQEGTAADLGVHTQRGPSDMSVFTHDTELLRGGSEKSAGMSCSTAPGCQGQTEKSQVAIREGKMLAMTTCWGLHIRGSPGSVLGAPFLRVWGPGTIPGGYSGSLRCREGRGQTGSTVLCSQHCAREKSLAPGQSGTTTSAEQLSLKATLYTL